MITGCKWAEGRLCFHNFLSLSLSLSLSPSFLPFLSFDLSPPPSFSPVWLGCISCSGIFMITAWIGLAGIGIFMPRFMKKAWMGPRWFQVTFQQKKKARFQSLPTEFSPRLLAGAFSWGYRFIHLGSFSGYSILKLYAFKVRLPHKQVILWRGRFYKLFLDRTTTQQYIQIPLIRNKRSQRRICSTDDPK